MVAESPFSAEKWRADHPPVCGDSIMCDSIIIMYQSISRNFLCRDDTGLVSHMNHVKTSSLYLTLSTSKNAKNW